MKSVDPLTSETASLVGARVREHRIARGLSMEKLAQLCGFSKETVRALEAGEYAPRLQTFLLLVRALDAGLEDLLPADWMARYAPVGRARGNPPMRARETPPVYEGSGEPLIDQRLIEAAKAKYPGLSTPDLVDAALKELIASDAAARVRALAGRIKGATDVSRTLRRRDRTT